MILFFSFSAFGFWPFNALKDTVSYIDVDIVETDEYPFIIDYLISGAGFEGSSDMKGRLKQFVSYWESTISAPRFVLDVISKGHKLPSIRVPDPCFIRNKQSSVLAPALLRKLFPSYWLLTALRSILSCLTA